MVSAISGINSYYSVYRPARAAGLAAEQAGQTQQIQNSKTALTLHRGADPETPIQPIRTQRPLLYLSPLPPHRQRATPQSRPPGSESNMQTPVRRLPPALFPAIRLPRPCQAPVFLPAPAMIRRKWPSGCGSST